MNPVFLDTVGLIAVWDDTDQWHAGAKAAYQRLLAQARPLTTTHLVLCECGNAAARRPYRADVKVLRDFLILEAVMRRLGLSEAFTNDKHFKAAGFTVLF
jgi:uncharacterized protein